MSTTLADIAPRRNATGQGQAETAATNPFGLAPKYGSMPCLRKVVVNQLMLKGINEARLLMGINIRRVDFYNLAGTEEATGGGPEPRIEAYCTQVRSAK